MNASGLRCPATPERSVYLLPIWGGNSACGDEEAGGKGDGKAGSHV